MNTNIYFLLFLFNRYIPAPKRSISCCDVLWETGVVYVVFAWRKNANICFYLLFSLPTPLSTKQKLVTVNFPWKFLPFSSLLYLKSDVKDELLALLFSSDQLGFMCSGIIDPSALVTVVTLEAYIRQLLVCFCCMEPKQQAASYCRWRMHISQCSYYRHF